MIASLCFIRRAGSLGSLTCRYVWLCEKCVPEGMELIRREYSCDRQSCEVCGQSSYKDGYPFNCEKCRECVTENLDHILHVRSNKLFGGESFMLSDAECREAAEWLLEYVDDGHLQAMITFLTGWKGSQSLTSWVDDCGFCTSFWEYIESIHSEAYKMPQSVKRIIYNVEEVYFFPVDQLPKCSVGARRKEHYSFECEAHELASFILGEDEEFRSRLTDKLLNDYDEIDLVNDLPFTGPYEREIKTNFQGEAGSVNHEDHSAAV